MEICVISHGSCPWEGAEQCRIHVMAKEEEEEGLKPKRWIILFTAVCSLTLSSISNAVIHMGGRGRGSRVHTHTHTRTSTSPYWKTRAHSHTKNWTKVQCTDKQLPDYSLVAPPHAPLLSEPPLYCTCLKFQALTLSAPRSLAFSVVQSCLLAHARALTQR